MMMYLNRYEYEDIYIGPGEEFIVEKLVLIIIWMNVYIMKFLVKVIREF